MLDTRGKAIEVNGYSCFFEKNECMLNFMLEMDEREKRCARQAENNPENAVMDNSWADASPAAQDGQADGQTETTVFQGEYGGNYRSLPLENRIAAAKKASDENSGSSQTATQPTSYTIMRGDTLNAICRRKYGDLGMVKQVCELNGIKNPNNIEVGQTILLP